MPMKLKNSLLLGPKGVSVVRDMVNLHMFLLSLDFFPICFKNKLMFFDLSVSFHWHVYNQHIDLMGTSFYELNTPKHMP